MAVPVPAGVVFSYNGVEFPSNVRTKVVEEPVTSGDNRFVKYSKLTISVSGYITQDEADGMAGAVAGEPLDAYMLTIRRRLQVHGKILKYVSKGFGLDLTINGQGTQRDVFQGPKSGKFSWWALGGAPHGCHGAGFEWEVVTHIAECGSFGIFPGVFLEVSFAVTYDIGEDGLLVRTTNGVAQIPMSMRLDGTFERCVDDEILRIIKPPPTGFLRKWTRQISPDRTTCNFNIADRQVEIPLPDDVVSIDMKYKVKQENNFAPNWLATISGTIRLSPTADKYIAWRRFLNIITQRIAHIRQHAGANSIQDRPAPGGGRTRVWKAEVVIIGSEMEEDLFSNSSRFAIFFRIMGAPFDTIAKLSGLWQPLVPAANPAMAGQWTAQSWKTSLARNAQAPKGISGASFDVADDVIIDICSGPRTIRPRLDPLGRVAARGTAGPGAVAVSDSDFDEMDDLVKEGGGELAAEDLHSPETSWISWECLPERIIDYRQVRHKPLAGTVRIIPPPTDFLLNAAASDTSDPESNWTASVPDVFQQTSAPSLTLKLTGFGVRLTYRVNPPRLISYGGNKAILLHERVRESVKGAAGNVRIYRTDWELTYGIPGPTETIPLLASPLLGTLGEA